MNKIILIIQREYLSRVKKKSFLLMTFLVPLFFIGMYVGVFFLTKKSFEDAKGIVYVIDDTNEIASQLENTGNITFTVSTLALGEQIEEMQGMDHSTNILMIPDDFYQEHRVDLLSSGKPNITLKGEVEGQLEQLLLEHQYSSLGIDSETIRNIDSKIHTSTKEITESGEAKDSDTRVAMGISMALSVLIYLSVFLYGAQVMRGVIEEKSNRIIEVIVSSVKPFELMLGKIVGIGLVGVTQFLLWVILSVLLVTVASPLFMGDGDLQQQMASQQQMIDEAGSSAFVAEIGGLLADVNFAEIFVCFFLFFIGGYLLYSALFAAVGSAVDSETEANQFTMPITMPLLLAYVLSFGVLINDPHGSIATWLSFIPLTSPIAMLVRVPFGVPVWEIAVSFGLLVGGFVLATWVASRIYRVGILMYGKKASFKELIKWFNYKN